MEHGKIVALLTAAMMAACQPSPTRTGLSEQGSPSRSNQKPVADESKALDIAAIELTDDKGALALMKKSGGASPAVAIVVRYKSAESFSNLKGCSLSVVEEISGQSAVVASSKNLLACSDASNLDGVKESISADVKGPGVITVTEQLAKSNSSFKLERHSSGDWFVTEIQFNHPENNLGTGYVDVVSEAVTYPLNAKRIRVSDYEYDKVRRDLVKTVIE